MVQTLGAGHYFPKVSLSDIDNRDIYRISETLQRLADKRFSRIRQEVEEIREKENLSSLFLDSSLIIPIPPVNLLKNLFETRSLDNISRQSKIVVKMGNVILDKCLSHSCVFFCVTVQKSL